MKFINFGDFETIKLEGIPYLSYKENELEICIELQIFGDALVALYENGDLVYPKQRFEMKFDQEMIAILVKEGMIATEKIIKKFKFELISAVNDLYKKYKLKKGEVCPRNKSKILE